MKLRFLKMFIASVILMQGGNALHAMNVTSYWLKAQEFLLGLTGSLSGVKAPQFPEKNADNFYCIETNKCYRCKQLDPHVLEKYLKKHDIQVIINLRAYKPTESWAKKETLLCKNLGITFYDFGFDPFILPSKEKLTELFHVLDLHAHEKILIHCFAGADRTGLIAALYVAEKMNGSLEDALFHQDSFFGHNEKAFPHMKKFIHWWFQMKKRFNNNLSGILNVYDPIEFMREINMPELTKAIMEQRV